MNVQEIRDRNMLLNERIANRLRERCGEPWADAWMSLVVTRGKRFGCIKLSKPSAKSDPSGAAGVLWEAWNHCRGQASAHRLGVGPASMSIGGAVLSCMFCKEPNASEAFSEAIDAILEVLKK